MSYLDHQSIQLVIDVIKIQRFSPLYQIHIVYMTLQVRRVQTRVIVTCFRGGPVSVSRKGEGGSIPFFGPGGDGGCGAEAATSDFFGKF